MGNIAEPETHPPFSESLLGDDHETLPDILIIERLNKKPPIKGAYRIPDSFIVEVTYLVFIGFPGSWSLIHRCLSLWPHRCFPHLLLPYFVLPLLLLHHFLLYSLFLLLPHLILSLLLL